MAFATVGFLYNSYFPFCPFSCVRRMEGIFLSGSGLWLIYSLPRARRAASVPLWMMRRAWWNSIMS